MDIAIRTITGVITLIERSRKMELKDGKLATNGAATPS